MKIKLKLVETILTWGAKIIAIVFFCVSCGQGTQKHVSNITNGHVVDYKEQDSRHYGCNNQLLKLFLKGEYDSVIVMSKKDTSCLNSDFAVCMYYLSLSEKREIPLIDSLILEYTKTINEDSLRQRLYPQSLIKKMGPYALHTLMIFDRLKYYRLDSKYDRLQYEVMYKRNFEPDTLLLDLERNLLSMSDEDFDTTINEMIRKYPKWKYLPFLNEFRNAKIDGKKEINLNE